ncbi:MAG: peptidoglycan DD-metalloendopeptidase family protein [Alphaproteobacteria bacterium]|nr:peptidoglycan DD-metalloendopeptidase family protein [Alphaproteobacteria bacterium]
MRHQHHKLPVLACALLAATMSAGIAHAAPRLGLPIDCKPGTDCFVQNYVDHDLGTGVRDNRCSAQTYDGHKGTDIRLRDRTVMEKGVRVLAAAKGTVKATRDGIPDVSIRSAGTEAIRGRECGNGVVIDHGGGWVTQYCHLRNGSLKVRQGDTVKAGALLGLVGLSGMTEFPHLHFEVRKDDTVIDPYTAGTMGSDGAAGCKPRALLWAPKTAASLAWQPVTFVDAAFAAAPPTVNDIEDARPASPTSVSPALVAWVRVLGVRAGDVETLAVTDPLNADFATSGPKTLERNKAQWLSYAGRKRDTPSWPLGNYKARYTLKRDGKVILEREFSFSLVR